MFEKGPPYPPRSVLVPWNTDAARRLKAAIAQRMPALDGCSVEVLWKGAPPHYPGCWLVVSLNEGTFKAVVQRYIEADGAAGFEEAIKQKLLELLELVESGSPVS